MTKENKNQFREGVLSVIKEMKLRQFIDGEFYVLKKEKVDYLKKLYKELDEEIDEELKEAEQLNKEADEVIKRAKEVF